ncbi:MAG: alpha/beta hydrolase [Bacteroidia bacterium]|nr:alpha/beta hydrolase [Bacteroidia bacterium]MCF8427273.1 alpha/beta hydrolase [Bacteroidia bacterium]
MKKYSFVLNLILVLSLSSCLRLDSNFYNLSDKITEYKWDNYPGNVDFKLDASYHIEDSMMHLFTLDSKGGDDKKSYKIYALYIGELKNIATDTVILYCHGNKWHMDFYWQRAKLLANVGGKHRYGVLMLDYRGYGLSEGPPSEEGLYNDVDAAMAWLKQNGLSNDRFIMYGFSLGTAPATELTGNPRSLTPHKLILEAPLASIDVMSADGAGLNVPGSYISNLKIDNAEEIKKVKQDLMWIHGVNDLFLSIETHGEVVFKNHGGTYKEAHRIKGADHGEVPATWGVKDYAEAVRKFIVR